MTHSRTLAGTLLELALLILAAFLWGAVLAQLAGRYWTLFLLPAGAAGGWFAGTKTRHLFP